MAALNDYLDLRVAVSDHVGNRAISDVFPRLTQQAEARLNQRLRTVWQVTDATLVFDEGVAQLPADFLEALHVYGTNGRQMRSGMSSDFLRPGSEWTRYQIGPGTISIRGYSGDRAIQYYAALPTLTASPSATNWLLERYPEVYLYAVGLQAAKFLRDVDLAQATEALFEDALRSLKIEDERMRWSNTTVRLQAQTP